MTCLRFPRAASPSRLALLAAFWCFGVAHTAAQTNGVLRELYTGLSGGGSIPALTNNANFPYNPADTFLDPSFEAPRNFLDQYGQRMRALLCPPVTGAYTFWIATDDNSLLYLSTSESPANKVLIASESSWAGWRAWNTRPQQKSAAITLQAGSRYYIEALQSEGAGGDNLSVTWQKPGDPAPVDGDPPIPGQYLVPYGLGPPLITGQPTNVTVIEKGLATFRVGLAVRLGCVYQWTRGGTTIPGATNSVYTVFPAALADNGAQFRCAITNGYGTTNSATAVLTVMADLTRPTLVSAGCLGAPQVVTVIFSEPVEAATATSANNYQISGGVSVLSAAFGLDSRTIILTTSPLVTQTNYTLVVNNVRDQATAPNSILPNSSLSFRLDPVPLGITAVRPNPEVPGPSSRHGPIVISEIMYHPASRADGKNLEFVEIFNSNPHYEDIGGYRITGDIEYTFPSGTTIPGRGMLVVAAAPADLQSVYSSVSVLGTFTNSLPNSSGTVRLRNRQGGIVFEVNYSGAPPWPAAADGAGHSLLLAWPSLGERNQAAWSASVTPGGTPGRVETPVYTVYGTVFINEVLAHTDLPEQDYLELFNYSSAPVDLSGCVLTDDPDTNKFVIPTGTRIEPLGFVTYDQTQLGFALSASGEAIYFKAPGGTNVLDALRFGAQENNIAFGRYPDGSKSFFRLQSKTPGSNNAPPAQSEVVINELMYAPLRGSEADQYVELYNRTATPIDVSRWTFEEGISYTLPSGTIIPPQGYLVVAKDALRLMSNYPNLSGVNTIGNFSGALARSGERVALAKPDQILSTNASGLLITNTIHIIVDEVTYDVGGRWGSLAHGGGSSLELIDSRANHRFAPNWSPSDETQKSSWTTLEYNGVLDNGRDPADSLQILTLGAGDYLVDNVEVFVAGGPNLVANSTFESGLEGWVAQGNHEDSTLESREGYNSVRSLHVRATGRGDTGANRIRTALTTPLNAGQIATIRAKVRWLAGRPEILLRLRGNWLEASGDVLNAWNLGTPGAANSRFRINAGPAITEVKHAPVLPSASQPVTVTARVDDPNGLAVLLLKYRLDPDTNIFLVNMVDNGAGLYSGVIPGQVSGALAAFTIEALDNSSPRQVTRFPNDAPARECLVRFGDPAQGGSFGTYRLWMTKATFDRWSNRERLSNKPLDCTFVYGNSRVIYNMGAQYSGSPWHAPGFNSPVGNVCDYLLNFEEDDPLMGESECTLQWPGNGGGDNTYQREQTAYWIAGQLGLPYCYRRSINLYVNGTRRAEMFEDAQQPNGDMMDEYYPEGEGGDLHKIQLWFEFNDAADTFTAGGASLQNVTTTGGQKKLPFYRWTFAKRAVHGSANDYSPIFALVDSATYPSLGDNYRRQIEARIDVDNWLRTYAVEHIVGNSDSFAYGGGQNMYTYKPLDDTWKMLIWDIDFAFAAADPASDVFQGIGRSNGIDLGEPAYKRRYWQILQDLATGPLTGTKMFPMLDAKYNAMVANGRSIESPASIKTYVSQRRANLLGLINSNVLSSFAITLNNGVGFTNSQSLITLTGIAPIDVRTITINGVPFNVRWTSVTNWFATVALTPGSNTLSVQGWGASGNLVTGATASITINYAGTAQTPESTVMISEIMYNPALPDASFVELFNSATNAFDLSGWRLDGAGFVFPGGTVLAPGAYLVVPGHRLGFAAAYGSTIPVTSEFGGTLSNNGELLQLLRPGGLPGQELVVDELRYEDRAPWPTAADGAGASLQLVDLTQENDRVANWKSLTNAPPPAGPQWRYVVAPGFASSSSLYMYLLSAGEVYIDDVKLVAGTIPETGPNLLSNGDFESAFPGPWGISANLSGSAVSTSIKHSGAASLRMVATSGGSSRASSIYQDITPALTINSPYTLSFWVLERTNGGTLTLRLSNSGIITNVNLLPGAGTPILTTATPGAPNSVRATLPKLPLLWLNEVLPQNTSGLADRLGRKNSWVELYNTSTTNIDLSGMFLANNYTNLLQWPFPSGTMLPQGQFLLVWLDANSAVSVPSELHANFTVAPLSGSVALVSTNGGSTNVIDYLNYDGVPSDRSYGAYPSGSPVHRRILYVTTPGGTNNPAVPPIHVLVNEWMADNRVTLADPADQDFEDWFELYNPGPAAADLSGYYLGQSLTNRTKFRIPAGTAIPPFGHLLVWADEETGQNSSNRLDLHVNFRLSKNGDAIGLFAPDTAFSIVDFVSFGPQDSDLSQGRFPDGSSFISGFDVATPGTTNYLVQPNTAPEVAPVNPCAVFEGQLLSIQLQAMDHDLPPQQLTFCLESGTPQNVAINPDTGLLSWRPSPDQAPSTNFISVRVSDSGEPPLSTMVSFEVRVLTRPRIESVRPDGSGGVSISVATAIGKSYQVQFKNHLQDQDWKPLTPPIYAAGDNLMVRDEDGTSGPHRFYRVVASE